MKTTFAIAAFACLVVAQPVAGTPACVLPVSDGGDIASSPASAQGVIAIVANGQITLSGPRTRPIRFGSGTQLFIVYGGIVFANQLKSGQHVFVWFVGCKDTLGTPPMAAVIELCSTEPEPCLK